MTETIATRSLYSGSFKADAQEGLDSMRQQKIMRLNKLLLVATSVFSLACGSLTDPLLLRTEIDEVAPNKVVCQGLFETTCLLIRRGGESSWQAFHGDIEGFVWGEGFYYVLEVRVYRVPNPLADGSSERYRLKRLVSRTSGPMP